MEAVKKETSGDVTGDVTADVTGEVTGLSVISDQNSFNQRKIFNI